MKQDTKVSCTILTGFLGSGKTTLLNRLLKHPELRDAAVLINEFGEIGLDHELIVHSEDRLVVLAGGCVCCALREDVEAALRHLFHKRDTGEIPAFTSIVIETTGLADPIPLLMTLQSFGLARERLSAPTVVTTVDAGLHAATLANHPQAARQIVAAHQIVVTKADIVGESQAREVAAQVAALNPWANVEVGQDAADSTSFVVRCISQQLIDNSTSQLVGPGADWGWPSGKLLNLRNQHHKVVSFPMIFDSQIDWTVFGVWMTLLLHRHGSKVLRIKGILNVRGLHGPVVIHAAQHMVHPPQHLTEWPSDDRRTRLVFIVDGLDPAVITRSLDVFLKSKTSDSTANVESHSAPAGAGSTVRGRPIRRPTAPRWIRG